ncbi:uncharacterized protein B0H18DRAFT_42628 [Fomitopsis serialis]|uniref:uncharacterized protein n=1 Tax=Fomitopsis serialis TaxID=139415 RepID=UPI002008E325|nr:uncharacterized protein B0H18DRAFT_42628 [Neoantrodia serialis]KAH9917226.1 hypothetical protein B0H18DRAFT_42628 [Neoantrodia serialis]
MPHCSELYLTALHVSAPPPRLHCFLSFTLSSRYSNMGEGCRCGRSDCLHRPVGNVWYVRRSTFLPFVSAWRRRPAFAHFSARDCLPPSFPRSLSCAQRESSLPNPVTSFLRLIPLSLTFLPRSLGAHRSTASGSRRVGLRVHPSVTSARSRPPRLVPSNPSTLLVSP